MRVVAGTRRGTLLKSISHSSVRPTTDQVRELVFNVISDIVRQSVVLDIFAGTGSLGIEALSRGATKAIFIEENKKLHRVIRDNLEKTRFQTSGEVLGMSAERGIKLLAKKGNRFNLVFMDPPYAGGLVESTASLLDDFQLIDGGGMLVIEYSKDTNLDDCISGNFRHLKTKIQGGTKVSFFEYGKRP
jgi:16S rRNA (guanine(966)-N(2))-methyltransferase RsmD